MLAPSRAIALLALSLAPQVAPRVVPSVAEEPARTVLLPLPERSLVLAAAEGRSVGELLQAFAALTGETVVMARDTVALVAAMPLGIDEALEVPPDEVHAFVEGMLSFHGFVVARIKGGQIPLLGVYDRQDELVAAPRVEVAREELALLERHPALLVRATLALEHVDVRQLSTSLRGLMTDARVQRLVAGGSGTLFVEGTGQDVLYLAGVVLEIDRLEGERAARRAEAQEHAQEDPLAPADEAPGDGKR